MKNNNKLARNAIRARKAQKKRANEQDKPKKGKRWLNRLFALIGCLLLVSALALPCFADTKATPPNYKTLFLEFYGLDADDPLYNLVYSNYFDEDYAYYAYQFQAPSVGSTIDYDEMLTFDTVPTNPLCKASVYDVRYGSLIEFQTGYWTTTYATSSGVRTYRLYYNEVIDGTSQTVLSIIIKFQVDTLAVTNVQIISGLYPINGSSADYIIGTICDPITHVPIDTACSYGLLNASIVADYRSFLNGWSVGYDNGYAGGYNDGYGQSTIDSYNNGYNNGVADGYDTGYNEGYDIGYDIGYDQGLSTSDGYQDGYNAAVSDIESGDFGRNFLGGIFSAPIEGLKELEIVSWTLADGSTVSISIITIFSAVVGMVLLLMFLKFFAGG